MSVDTSAEAVEQHLAYAGMQLIIKSPNWGDSAGVSTRVGWHRANDRLMRALAAERDALMQHRAAAQASVQSIEAQAASLWGRVQAVEAERDALRAERKKAWEEAAQWHDEQAKAASEWRYWGGPSDGAMQASERHHIDSAAALRARAAQEGQP